MLGGGELLEQVPACMNDGLDERIGRLIIRLDGTDIGVTVMKHHGFPVPSLWPGPTASDNSHQQGPCHIQLNHVCMIHSYRNNHVVHIYSGRGNGPYGKSPAALFPGIPRTIPHCTRIRGKLMDDWDVRSQR